MCITPLLVMGNEFVIYSSYVVENLVTYSSGHARLVRFYHFHCRLQTECIHSFIHSLLIVMLLMLVFAPDVYKNIKPP
jgi:hypothetical protein